MKLTFLTKYYLVGVLAIGLMWLCAPKSEAKDNHLYTGAWSHHITESSDTYNYNETNNLVGVQYQNVVLATFKNSHNQQTQLAGVYFTTPLKDTPIEVSVIAGVVYGYKDCFGRGELAADKRYCGLLAPEITLNLGLFKPSIILLGKNIQVLTFKWEF